VCDGRLTLGLGVSHHWIIDEMLGLPYERPVPTMRAYLDVLDQALRGPGTVDVENEFFRVHQPLDVTDVAPTPVMIAALGPLMLRLAGERTDGTILAPLRLMSHARPRSMVIWMLDQLVALIDARLPLVLACASLASMAVAVAAAEKPASERAKEFKLANGLDVIVIPDHRAPVVTQMIWYKVGAADEPPGSSGIAHFLEHLMFKGTDTIPTGQFSKIVARNGGEDNAFTNHDVTAYFQRVAKDRLPTVMAMEADRMANLRLTEDDGIANRERHRLAHLIGERAVGIGHPRDTPRAIMQSLHRRIDEASLRGA
jgi:hypothetical protein